MRPLAILTLLALLGAALGASWGAPALAQSRPPAAQPAFLSVIDDVPLMPGLAERPEAAVTFDKPEGRIVEAEAAGRVSRAEVLKFYAASLPQLGWRARGEGRFLRDREELAISFPPNPPGAPAGSLTVRFGLSPDR